LERSSSKAVLIGLLGACVVAGCGGGPADASQTQQREVAFRFARAVLRGDVPTARGLLASREAALVTLVERGAVPWRAQHAAIARLAGQTDDRWTFRYVGRRTHADGRFETERGALVVFVGRTEAGAGVTYFLFTDVRRRFSTHHDALLLPSNR
jgi:hypothetical protein